MYEELPFEEEMRAVSHAIPRRRREFAAGRAAARRALREFGVTPTAILAQPDRAPKWPPGIVGSISHCADCCVAVVARGGDPIGIGIDVEEAIPLPADVLPMICGNNEVQSLASTGFGTYEAGKILFCAKEAFYKCYYPITHRFLDFLDVSLLFSPSNEGSSGMFRLSQMVTGNAAFTKTWSTTGRWLIEDGLVFAGVVARLSKPSPLRP